MILALNDKNMDSRRVRRVSSSGKFFSFTNDFLLTGCHPILPHPRELRTGFETRQTDASRQVGFFCFFFFV